MPPPTSDRPARPPRPHPPTGAAGPRRLRRRPDDGHIAGVCAGVAEYFNVDPVLVRIAAVVLLFSGPGFFAYVLAWIFVPAEPGLARFGEPQAPIDRKDRATQIFGIVLLGLGVSVIWGDWWSPLRGWLFPLGLMALGAWLLFRPDRDDDPPSRRCRPPRRCRPCRPAPRRGRWPPRRHRAGRQPATPTPPPAVGERSTATPTTRRPPTPTTSDPMPTATADPTSTPTATASTDPTTVQPTTGPRRRRRRVGRATAHRARGTCRRRRCPAMPLAARPASGHDRHHRHRHRHLVGPGVFGVLLIWTGVAWLTGVGLTTGLAVGLVILGLGFVLGSFVGGSRALIFPALLVAIALAITAFVDIPLLGPDRRAALVAGLARRAGGVDAYEVSMGEGTLDLSELRAAADARRACGPPSASVTSSCWSPRTRTCP